MSTKNLQSHTEWSGRSLLIVIGILIITCLSIVLATAPFMRILGPGVYAIAGALHGLTSFIFLLSTTIGLYLGWRLFMGRIRSYPDLQLVTTVMATMAFLTIIVGNWIYIPYRVKTAESPRTYFLENMPEVHKIFFEFKEYTALFTLPLSVAAAFILWRYGAEILERKWTRIAVSILIALTFFYLVIAFGLGAAVTKLKSI